MKKVYSRKIAQALQVKEGSREGLNDDGAKQTQ
jgi:hypothetical protein